MKKLIIVCLISLLLGCGYLTKDEIPTIIPDVSTKPNTTQTEQKKIVIDKTLLKECPTLVGLGDTSTYISIIENIKENTIIYNGCKDNNSSLIKIIKDAFNLK